MRPRGIVLWFAVAVSALAIVPAAGGPADAKEVRPAVRGPITGGLWGHALFDAWYDIAADGYEQDEYFVSGVATNDERRATAPYTTRIIVTRPIDARDFNGTVLLDWVNVTAQFENAVDTISAQPMLMREGWAFVHVSAQAVGVCCTPLTPKVWDPIRYAELSHPGDAFANDIFTQVADAMRSRVGADPLDGLRAERIVAAGQSQSASRLSSYVRTTQPRARAIDAFLIHGGGSKVFARPPTAPVLHLLSDLEADPEQPSTTTNYRLWEIAGAAHSDFWTGYHQEVGAAPRVLLHAARSPASVAREIDRVAGNFGGELHPMQAVCVAAGALFPTRYAVNAALHHLDAWVRTGSAPRNGPRFRFDGAGLLARDANRNALGGIRLPPIVHPVATYESTTCGLGGITVPFDTATLQRLYPTHDDYYAKMRAATKASVGAGFLLPEDARDLLERACLAKVPSAIGARRSCGV
jgi:hypothetical protein